MLERFLTLVQPEMRLQSGKVFYSGRSSFSSPSHLYLLGLNPGGDPDSPTESTMEEHIRLALTEREHWSEYSDECWLGKAPGTHGMQPRVLHLLKRLGKDPRDVPSSNAVFVRTPREAHLGHAKTALLKMCWPVHEAVITELGVRVVICFGGTTGRWVRKALQADTPTGEFVERNARRWISRAHRNSDGLTVVTLTHPSIADWTNPATDPSELVVSALRDRSAR